jgi:NO-binding membrane sensor protein with MHYT domain
MDVTVNSNPMFRRNSSLVAFRAVVRVTSLIGVVAFMQAFNIIFDIDTSERLIWLLKEGVCVVGVLVSSRLFFHPDEAISKINKDMEKRRE